MSNNTSTHETANSAQKQHSKSNDQPLKRSTYNIFEACDVDTPMDSLLDSSSIHPLDTVSPYSLDLSPNNTKSDNGDITNMMKDLDLSTPPSNTIEMKRSGTMPYCV